MKTLLAILLLTATPIMAQSYQLQLDTSVPNSEMDSWLFASSWGAFPSSIGTSITVNANGVITADSKIGPHFTSSPQGWIPSCPRGTTLVRHSPPPDCIWGVKPMNRKPSEGEFECVDTAGITYLTNQGQEVTLGPYPSVKSGGCDD